MKIRQPRTEKFMAASNGSVLVYNVQVAPYTAKGTYNTNSHDDTATIQQALNDAATAAVGTTAVVYFPQGVYGVSQLTVPAGVVLQGVHSSAYGNSVNMDAPGYPASVLESIGSSNKHVLLFEQGQNYQRIFDLGIDGNKNNNTLGYGAYIEDELTAGGNECQIIFDRCFFFNCAEGGIYLGHGRRAVKVYNSTLNYTATGDGITVANSDSTIQNCIIGSNHNGTTLANSGVRLGTTQGLHGLTAWSSRTDSTGTSTTNGSKTVGDTHAVAGDLGKRISGTGLVQAGTYITAVTPGTGYTVSKAATATGTPTLTVGTPSNAAAVTHVLGNDLYQNDVGINVCSGSWASLIQDNGMDRHYYEGIAVYDGDANSIVGNAFHSNGTQTDNTYGHIQVGASVSCIRIDGNVFGPLDNGVSNVASYGVVSNTGTPNTILGDLGTIDSTSTRGGLIFATAGDWGLTTGKYTGEWQAADQGALAWTQDIATAANSSVVPTAGTLYIMKIHLPIAAQVNNILMHVVTAGVGLTNPQCFAGIWDTSNNKKAVTGDMSGTWNSTGLKIMPISGGAVTLAAGDYYIGFYFNGTTGPAMARGNNQGGAAPSAVNLGATVSPYRFATANTGLTTTPPATLGAQTSTNFAWWAAIN